jgi:23S rRNA pseudouridine2605 synthase
MQIRLQKLISQAGITSRRKAEALITDGCVTVNGRIVTELGTKADPERDHVKVNGKLLHVQAPSVYLMLNKPDGIITTLDDPEGRPTVMNLVRNVKGRLYPVGRLDYHTEGLLLMTNDGALAHALMHPSSGVMKRYHVKIKGVVEDDQIARLSRGVKLGDGTTAPCTINKLRLHEKNSWLEVILHEGRYRQVRRMFESIGRFVIKLRRVGYAGLSLGDLPIGKYRRLTPSEVESLRRAAGKVGGERQRPGASVPSVHAQAERKEIPSSVRVTGEKMARPPKRLPNRSYDRSSERPSDQPGTRAGQWTKKPGWGTHAPSGRRDRPKPGWSTNPPTGRRDRAKEGASANSPSGRRHSAKRGPGGRTSGFMKPRGKKDWKR